jgi:prepilin-type N-terminal cleavage/methylation domain-containing protein
MVNTSCGFCQSRSSAFSLLELLVVVALIALMSSFAIATVRDFSTSKGVEVAAFEAQALVEFARSQAMVKRTPVWLAFREVTNQGKLEVEGAVFGSKDGTFNANATNLSVLSRVLRLRGVGMSRFADLSASTLALTTNTTTPAELVGNSAGITATNIPSKPFQNRWTMTFTPVGEVTLDGTPGAADGFEPYVGFGFVPTRGDVPETPRKQDVGILVEGSTGTARILRTP